MEEIECKKCKCTDFFITESLTWNASSDEEGGLFAPNKGNEIESIICRECGEELQDIENININFQ